MERKRTDSTDWVGINPENDLEYLQLIAAEKHLEDALKNIKPIERKLILKGEGEANITKREGTKITFEVKAKTDGKSKRKSKI
jgi:hypothetical protein